MKLYVIGAGGAGSWLIPQLVMLKLAPVVVVDKDKLELSNMNRQLFDHSDIGSFKGDALKKRWSFSEFIPEWYFSGLVPHSKEDIIFGCVDNHAGRRSILGACDSANCRAVILGNGTINADAYWYDPKWKGTKLDPRVRFPEIDTANDGPLRAEGCTGDAQDNTPQLVVANTTAVSLALQLFWLWVIREDEFKDVQRNLPVQYAVNDTALQTIKVKDLQ